MDMKRTFLLLFLAATASTGRAQYAARVQSQPREEQPSESRQTAPAQDPAPAQAPASPRPRTTVIKREHRNVPSPGPAPRQAPAVQSAPSAPRPSGGGRTIRPLTGQTPPAGHTSIMRDREVIRDMRARRRVEVVPNRTVWREVN